MNDNEVLQYLLSHAPLDQFYILEQQDTGNALMSYFDSSGKPWNIMEDDNELAARAVAILKESGVKVFSDYATLAKYEQERKS